jgi:hypothetical protein
MSGDKAALWWMSYPKIESRKLKAKPLFAKPDLEVGQYILLSGKPDKPRKILEIEWRAHRYEFVYIVETSAENFKPYWFRDKLVS